MSKKMERAPYVVIHRYRTRGRWQERGEELQLLPIEAQGPLSTGNLAKARDAERALKAAAEAEKIAADAAAKPAKESAKVTKGDSQ